MNSTNEPRVLKHGLATRLFHWTLILGFLPAAFTGLVIWLKPGSEDFINLAMRIHIIGAVILSIGCIGFSVFAFDRVAAFARRCFTWTKDDMEWLKVSGGYPQKMFFGKIIPVPPMGKINSGQKQMGLFFLFAGPVLIVTGWILYLALPLAPKLVSYYADILHLVLGLFLTACVIAHIFLGIYNWGEFKAMFGDGTQPIEEAKHHNPLWIENEIEKVK